jgi:hypothetical protein
MLLQLSQLIQKVWGKFRYRIGVRFWKIRG